MSHIPGKTLEEVARSLFGDDDDAVGRWLDFWATGPQRCRHMLETLFEPIVLTEFGGSRVLDVGCGTAAMADVLEPAPRFYAGLDSHDHVVRFGPRRGGVGLLVASGTRIPFARGSFDYVFALDVLEHVQGGRGEQVRFLRELRRVIGPAGMIFLTTPNRWYPREGHTGLVGPQYLPTALADRYIRRRRPSFLEEHGTFAEITSLGPRELRRSLAAAGLAFLHQVPCGQDSREYRRQHRWRGLLERAGLGWWPHAEFWGAVVRVEQRGALRAKRRSRPGMPDGETQDFGPEIDFSAGDFASQLGGGWHLRETNGDRGFRWTQSRAVAWLQSRADSPYVRIQGFGRPANRLDVFVDGHRVGEIQLGPGDSYDRTFLLPHSSEANRVYSVELKCLSTFHPEGSDDVRELGVAVFSLGLTGTL